MPISPENFGPRRSFELGSLSPTDFEEFVYGLLKELGFTELCWRKGSNENASVSDQGRDLEATSTHRDVDGGWISERWLVECKRHARAVPPTQLNALLAWAEAERPNRVLIVVSGFLSNAAKNFLESYQTNTRPPFKIKVWERTELETLSAGKFGLLTKFGLSTTAPHLNFLHPVHAQYLTNPPLVDLDQLFEALDEIEPQKRLDMLGNIPSLVIRRRLRPPVTGEERMKDLLISDHSYEAIKSRCYEIAELTTQLFVVWSLIGAMLEVLLRLGNRAGLQTAIDRNEMALRWFEEELHAGDESYAGIVNNTREHIARLPEQTDHYSDLYNEFCDSLLRGLYIEAETGEYG